MAGSCRALRSQCRCECRPCPLAPVPLPQCSAPTVQTPMCLHFGAPAAAAPGFRSPSCSNPFSLVCGTKKLRLRSQWMALARSAGPGAGLHQVLFAEPNLSAADSASCSRVTGNQRDLGPIHFIGEDAGAKPRASGLPGEFSQR